MRTNEVVVQNRIQKRVYCVNPNQAHAHAHTHTHTNTHTRARARTRARTLAAPTLLQRWPLSVSCIHTFPASLLPRLAASLPPLAITSTTPTTTTNVNLPAIPQGLWLRCAATGASSRRLPRRTTRCSTPAASWITAGRRT